MRTSTQTRYIVIALAVIALAVPVAPASGKSGDAEPFVATPVAREEAPFAAKNEQLRGPLGTVVIGAALASGSSAVADEGGRHYFFADEGGRHYRPAPHHEVTDGDQRPYRPAPHHPQPGQDNISYAQAVNPPPVASSGWGIDWDDAVIGGATIAVLVATAGVFARRRPTPPARPRPSQELRVRGKTDLGGIQRGFSAKAEASPVNEITGSEQRR